MTLRFTDAAATDIRGLIDWLAERSPTAARKAAWQIFVALDRLDDFPESAAADDSGMRQLTIRFGRDGFLARYRIDGENVWVERVLHGLQDR